MTTAATTALTYNGYVTQIATLAVVNTTTSSGVMVGVDPAFNALIPQMLNYAELRIQRDLDLLPSQIENTSYALTAGNNKLAISVNDYVTLETVSVVSSDSTYPLLPVSKEFIQNTFPSSSSTFYALPAYFAVYGGDASTVGSASQNIIVGPWPYQSYQVVLTGTARMPTLYQFANATYAATGTTFISTWLPDMLIMASMIYISAFQRDFSSAGNDPQMPIHYEAQYQTLLKSAMGEEYRKKFEADAWSSYSTSPAATPSRG